MGVKVPFDVTSKGCFKPFRDAYYTVRIHWPDRQQVDGLTIAVLSTLEHKDRPCVALVYGEDAVELYAELKLNAFNEVDYQGVLDRAVTQYGIPSRPF